MKIQAWPGSPAVVLLCADCEQNEARYINQRGHLVCGLCPITNADDAILISKVPELLTWCRVVLRGGVMKETSFEALRNILGKKPKLPW